MRPPILLIHGAFSCAAHLTPWAEYFRQAGYHCVAPSLPGHDRSSAETLAHRDLSHYLEMLGEICVSLDRPPVIIGHGLGGLLAQHLRATADCEGAVLVASWPAGAFRPRPRGVLNGLPMLGGILRSRPVKPGRSVIRTLALHDLSVAEREDILDEFVAESGRAIRAPILGKAEVPGTTVRRHVLVVSGSADRIVPKETPMDLARLYQAEHIVIPGQGHWLIAGSLVGVVAAAVLDWLERLEEGALATPGDPSFRIAMDV
jgi:pimeloyl-ACP methyl ester carboxylesterase